MSSDAGNATLTEAAAAQAFQDKNVAIGQLSGKIMELEQKKSEHK